ncbi:MAG: YdcF family protein [Lachnospiraceae bacterium]|nr:YdcF family protein [Lachnospiraceae bacterium]
MVRCIFYAATIIAWGIFIYAFQRDRSRYRNCLILFAALMMSAEGLLLLAGARIFTMVLLIVFFGLLLVPVFLIWNGVITLRKEGLSITHLLSLALGMLVGIGEVTTLVLYFRQQENLMFDKQQMVGFNINTLMLIISVSVIYLSISFLMFMIYSIFLMLIPHKRNFDYVIIHGAGLSKGEKLTKLLAERVDKAMLVYQKAPTPPYLIPSGGRGDDEKISEAEAMKKYLIENGIPEDHILAEDQSTTTFENLVNSKKIIDARGGRCYTALVTSNYHVYRALRYCRKVGLQCTGIGSHVAFYYWPSALIREYVAVHAEKKHAVMLVAGWILVMAAVMIMLMLYYR